MNEAKNLATCKPSEFLKQTYKIKNSVEKWMTDIDIMNIRKNLPQLTPLSKDMSDEERRAIFEENKKKSEEQIRKNSMAILDAIMDKHAEETLEILALCCFVEPEHVDDYTVEFYLNNFSEIISNKAVVGFFTSLAQLGVMNTSSVSRL